MSAAFDPFDFSFPIDDDECQFGTLSLDEPFTDLFDQLVNQDSSDFSDRLNGSDAFTDSISSGSCTNSSKQNGLFPTKSSQPREGWQDNDPFVHFKSSSISKAYQPGNTVSGVSAAVSGTELLNIEGLLPHGPSFLDSAFSPPHTPLAPAVPRKSKSHGALNSGHQLRHKISKGSHHTPLGSHKMMRPSYYYRHEVPSPKEWQEQFDRFSLQSPALNFPLSPPLSSKTRQDDFPPHAPINNHKHMQRTQNLDPQLEQTGTAFDLEPPPRSYRQRIEQNKRQNGAAVEVSKGIMNRAMKTVLPIDTQLQAASWHESSVITSGQDESFWSSELALPTTEAETIESSFASQGLMINCDPFSELYIQDSLPGYHVETSYQVPPITATTSHNPRTPSPPSSRSPSPSATHRLRRRRKSSSHISKSRSRTPKTPRTPRDASGFGFVNFTPSDSRKILTGVAPSGSSKTKARREMEACERTKRLSLAAIRAVREAGGDVERLGLGLGVGVGEEDEEELLE